MKTLLICGMLALLFLGFAIFFGVAIIRRWDLGVDSSFLLFVVVLEGLAGLICSFGFFVELYDYIKALKERGSKT